jgi:hypothetical protein
LDLRCSLRRTHRLGIDDEMSIGERQLAIGVHLVLPSELDLSGSRGCNVFLIRLEAGTEGRSFPIDARRQRGQELNEVDLPSIGLEEARSLFHELSVFGKIDSPDEREHDSRDRWIGSSFAKQQLPHAIDYAAELRCSPAEQGCDGIRCEVVVKELVPQPLGEDVPDSRLAGRWRSKDDHEIRHAGCLGAQRINSGAPLFGVAWSACWAALDKTVSPCKRLNAGRQAIRIFIVLCVKFIQPFGT